MRVNHFAFELSFKMSIRAEFPFATIEPRDKNSIPNLCSGNSVEERYFLNKRKPNAIPLNSK